MAARSVYVVGTADTKGEELGYAESADTAGRS